MAKAEKEKRRRKIKGAVRLPIFLPFAGCPFRCIYCQQQTITAQSEPLSFSHISQMVEEFAHNNAGSPKEVAFFGGTFSALPLPEQERYLEIARSKLGEDDTIRLSTRPDCLSRESLDLFKKYGVDTVELGVQSFSDVVLECSGRGYDGKQAIDAVRMLQGGDFGVTVQLMPFLPSWSDESLAFTLRTTLGLQPDEARIYPTIVLKGTKLADDYSAGKYFPPDLQIAVDLCRRWYAELEANGIRVIKIGLHSDVGLEASQVIAGPYHPSFGELVKIENFYQEILKKYENEMSVLEVEKNKLSYIYGHGNYLLKKLGNRYGDFEVRVIKNS